MRRQRLPRRPPASRGERAPWMELAWTAIFLLAVASFGKGEDNVDCYTAEDQGASYVGTVNVTINGLVCQRWDAQSPWTHRWDPSDHPDKNLTSNYCRNPDDGAGPWCYTTNPDISFEYCNISVCPNGEYCNISVSPSGDDYCPPYNDNIGDNDYSGNNNYTGNNHIGNNDNNGNNNYVGNNHIGNNEHVGNNNNYSGSNNIGNNHHSDSNNHNRQRSNTRDKHRFSNALLIGLTRVAQLEGPSNEELYFTSE
ncbi:LPA [Branchiostoma lanceolatum]|uniref:LPA protein n=1 Tax=Branchiostoma lanceolatum TaxID=7740 RepID=A0A8K0A1P9_BRALA|nr:LPA [Branchiostoma lanceolatum]